MPPSDFGLKIKSMNRDDRTNATEMAWDIDREDKAGSISTGS
jgi:hypothetical protein